MEMVDVAKNRRTSARELLEELGNLLGGLGVVAMSVFWLAAPILALAVPLALPPVVGGLAIGLLVTLLASPVVLVWRLTRGRRRASTPPGPVARGGEVAASAAVRSASAASLGAQLIPVNLRADSTGPSVGKLRSR